MLKQKWRLIKNTLNVFVFSGSDRICSFCCFSATELVIEKKVNENHNATNVIQLAWKVN